MSTDYKPITSRLRDELNNVRFDSDSLESFRGKPVMARGFFPGGNGLFQGDAAAHFPSNGALILGSNFGCVRSFVFEGKLVTQDETSNATWRPLLKLLKGAGIDPEECFFTNAWPCLHRGESNVASKFMRGWLKNEVLTESCTAYFLRTCAEMNPTLIVALGCGPAAFLAKIWQGELAAWRSHTIKGMDQLPIGEVQLEAMSGKTICVAVVHPCGQGRNAWRRKPPYQHPEGEIRLLKKAHRMRQEHASDTGVFAKG